MQLVFTFQLNLYNIGKLVNCPSVYLGLGGQRWLHSGHDSRRGRQRGHLGAALEQGLGGRGALQRAGQGAAAARGQ